MNTILRAKLPAAGVALAMLILGCKPLAAPEATPSPTPSPTPSGPPPVLIGLLLPLSGTQSSFGSDAIRGAELALEEINASGGLLGRPAALLTRDTRSEAGTTASLAAEMAADASVPIVVGEITSDRTLEVARALATSKKPLISPASTLPEITSSGDNVFRTCYADPSQGRAMARLANSLNVERAAILSEANNAYSSSLAASFRDAFPVDGGQIIADLSFSDSAGSLQTAIDTIARSKPDVVFLPGYYEDAARVLQAARSAGLDMPFLGGDGWDSPDFLAAAGPAADNCYIAGHFSHEEDRPETRPFVEKYQATHSSPPPPLAALTYDAVRIAAHAISSSQSVDPTSITTALASLENFPGITGPISLNNSRTPQKPVVILRIQDGNFEFLESIPPEHVSP